MESSQEQIVNMSTPPSPKDPRKIARQYQLDLCKRAVEENIIVYLGTGCGKTHIAVLLMYELAHLIRKPSRDIFVFLAPTVPLVRQQAEVIKNSANFKVSSYFGNNHPKTHDVWDKEMQEFEVLVMTPQILLQTLHHCFIKMEFIALLIFDECHHAQGNSRHPYAEIMKEFYETDSLKYPRIFGMTASPTIGKGGSDYANYTRCINSLEELLHAKVCSVNNDLELEKICPLPDVKVYSYAPGDGNSSAITLTYSKELGKINDDVLCLIDKSFDGKDIHKIMKSLSKIHENLIYCLENLGLYGANQAASVFLHPNGLGASDIAADEIGVNENNHNSYLTQYLNKATSILSCNLAGSTALTSDNLIEPCFSKKLLALVEFLSNCRLRPDFRCIIFVKRVIVARCLKHIFQRLKCLDFWKCEYLVGFHSGLQDMSRKKMDTIIEKFSSGKVNLLVATNVAEEGLDIQTCCLVVRFDLPDTVASYIQSRGRARTSESEYIFLIERGNSQHEKLLNDFMVGEKIMNEEVHCRTSKETFDALEEKIYKVYSTGASISTSCSVSLLHVYCAKLPRDVYFTPSPKFFYFDDLDGTICRVTLPPNAPFRQIESVPCSSKDEAKRLACLNACMQLHKRGALSDYLLPGVASEKIKESSESSPICDGNDDVCLSEELHEMLVPNALRVAWDKSDKDILMHSYYINLVPIPEDREYRPFALFVKAPLPKEAEKMKVDLHLAHHRIVKAGLESSDIILFSQEEIMLAESFQEMCLKIILDRSEFFSDYVCLGENGQSQEKLSTFYLLLPVCRDEALNFSVDWSTVRRCLSSQVFGNITSFPRRDNYLDGETLELINGPISKSDIIGSLIFTPHNKSFYFVDSILEDFNAYAKYGASNSASYAEHYSQRFGLQLLYPEQPFLKAKHLFTLRNLLCNRLLAKKEARDWKEHFLELPPELCSLKIIGFSKDIGSSLSLLPSFMHHLEKLLVAIELKDMLSASIPEATEIKADRILEALTTEKCLGRVSLERLEVLGDAFLKYVVSRHSFLSYEALDEGQLTNKRSDIINNAHLYELAIRKNLQVYICDEPFYPPQFFALGRPCNVVCNIVTESVIHSKEDEPEVGRKREINIKCTNSHRWLHKKTIADVVEAMIGVFLVESGNKAAKAFLEWIGIQVEFGSSDVDRACKESDNNLSLIDMIDITALEDLIGYKFRYKGLLLQAFIHPSYNKHLGGCYQKLEFVGDAVLDYLITSYMYSAYPDLKPGQLTDLKSLVVNNNSFARLAVLRSFHSYLIKDSSALSEAINKFGSFVQLSNSERETLEEPPCPKVLGDIIESCVGAVLLDTGFQLNIVWKIILKLLSPILEFPSFQVNPLRELRELCQSCNIDLNLPKPESVKEGFHVKVEFDLDGRRLSFGARNNNSKVARTMAAQKALSKLKASGFRHKNRSLEEVLSSMQKKKPELIGYDEDPGIDSNIDLVLLESDKTSSTLTNGVVTIKSAISQLHEICTANHWSPPCFILCKEAGPSHLRMFTYKVVVKIPRPLECYSEPKPQKQAAKEHASQGALWYLRHRGHA